MIFYLWVLLLFNSYLISYAIISYVDRKRVRGRILLNTLKLSKIDQAPRNYFPIKYCDEERYKKIWKFFPWEGAGWLVDKGDDVIFLSEHNLDVIEKRFPRSKTLIEWEGVHKLRNGMIPWIRFVMDDRSYYFTSETGSTIFGSKAKTQKIFKTIGNAH